MIRLKKIVWFVAAALAVIVGIYPTTYFLIDMSDGFSSSKSAEVLASQLWNTSFYTHIAFGGIALFLGWMQFSPKFRATNMGLHRTIGKIYVVSVLLSGITGLYISLYASGGIATKLGFFLLSTAWIITTTLAYTTIRKKKVTEHRNWMIRSYALTFAAVTLRLWMPLLYAVIQPELGIDPYTIVAWLCWVPNLIFAQYIINKRL